MPSWPGVGLYSALTPWCRWVAIAGAEFARDNDRRPRRARRVVIAGHHACTTETRTHPARGLLSARSSPNTKTASRTRRCPDFHNDDDGVFRRADRCPAKKKTATASNEDGCPAPDNDHDGILTPKTHARTKRVAASHHPKKNGCPTATRDVLRHPDSRRQGSDQAEDARLVRRLRRLSRSGHWTAINIPYGDDACPNLAGPRAPIPKLDVLSSRQTRIRSICRRLVSVTTRELQWLEYGDGCLRCAREHANPEPSLST